MENQKMEFRSFLSSMYDKLENLKHSDFDEEDLTQLALLAISFATRVAKLIAATFLG
jgi:hypothetical protein